MNNILLENKAKVLERLVLQDIAICYGRQEYSEKSYDALMAKLLDRMTGFYEDLEPDSVSLQRLSRYGDRAKIYTEQLRADLDEAAKACVRQIVKQLPREKLDGSTQWDVMQAVRPVLKRRIEALSNLLSASTLQMQNYMLLWDYQDAGFTHYCLLTEGENCDACNRLEGLAFPIGAARVGMNFTPMHPNCNCRIGVLDEENRVITIIDKGKEHEVPPDDKNIKTRLDSISNVLTTASLIPELDTLTNLASIPVDLARGDWFSAGLSALGVVPVVGEVADTAKLAKMADKAVDISRATKTATNFKSFPKKIHIGKQGKHILGHNNYQKGKSILNISTGDAQKLINKYTGKGRKIGTNRETVNFKKVIGKYVDPKTGKAYDTTVGTIHYSKSGTHLVPDKPINWRK